MHLHSQKKNDRLRGLMEQARCNFDLEETIILFTEQKANPFTDVPILPLCIAGLFWGDFWIFNGCASEAAKGKGKKKLGCEKSKFG